MFAFRRLALIALAAAALSAPALADSEMSSTAVTTAAATTATEMSVSSSAEHADEAAEESFAPAEPRAIAPVNPSRLG